MRLLDTSTLKFEQFEGLNVPKYAILSHRWSSGEVLFAEVQNGPSEEVQKKIGWNKIVRCCQRARRDEIAYVWIDTCCIDKSSSAELAEAINSMFKWYEESYVCYAYLSDVEETTRFETRDGFKRTFSVPFLTQFYASEWFDRGWTLQELLAPRSMTFFNRYWDDLGNKDELCNALTCITCIPAECLLHERKLSSYTVAQRMSWASRRLTTRVEDLAYSLLGIFNVNMPLLYGERESAFIRLQEEILRRSNDESVLLWHGEESGLLARSPSAFAVHLPVISQETMNEARPSTRCPIEIELRCRFRKERQPCTLTNIGLSITLQLVPWYMDIFLVKLQVERIVQIDGHAKLYDACIFLRQTINDSRLARVQVHEESIKYLDATKGPALDSLFLQNLGMKLKPYVIAHDGWDTSAGEGYLRSWNVAKQRYGFKFSFQPHHCWGEAMTVEPRSVLSRSPWCSKARILAMRPGDFEVVAVFHLSQATRWQYLYFGFTPDFTPVLVQKDWHIKSPFKSYNEFQYVAKDKPGLLTEALAYDHFWESINRADSKQELVIQGSQDPYQVRTVRTDVEGLSVMISRWTSGYTLDFIKTEHKNNLKVPVRPVDTKVSQAASDSGVSTQAASDQQDIVTAFENLPFTPSPEPVRPTGQHIRKVSAILTKIGKFEHSLNLLHRTRPGTRLLINGQENAEPKTINSVNGSIKQGHSPSIEPGQSGENSYIMPNGAKINGDHATTTFLDKQTASRSSSDVG